MMEVYPWPNGYIFFFFKMGEEKPVKAVLVKN